MFRNMAGRLSIVPPLQTCHHHRHHHRHRRRRRHAAMEMMTATTTMMMIFRRNHRKNSNNKIITMPLPPWFRRSRHNNSNSKMATKIWPWKKLVVPHQLLQPQQRQQRQKQQKSSSRVATTITTIVKWRRPSLWWKKDGKDEDVPWMEVVMGRKKCEWHGLWQQPQLAHIKKWIYNFLTNISI